MGRRRGRLRDPLLAVVVGAAGVLTNGTAARAGEVTASSFMGTARVEDLTNLSIEQLGQIEVTSVSKKPQALNDAAASIYVITHDDIVRSGATSVPEMLRLAPNLQVEQTTASQYIITARGMSGNGSAQNFSNKLLVLIDGRTVYTPLYSGVYWDIQDVLPEDVERIEVISGAGATLWGANAVNGVINIITRKSGETQGGVLDVAVGTLETSLGVRYGGKINDDLTYRLYAKDFYDAESLTPTGATAHDQWTKPQAGFRIDWTASSTDSLTLQGDAYRGDEAQDGAPDQIISGANVLGRWDHAWRDGASLQVQTYFDHTARATDDNGGHFTLDTYDLDVQDSFALGRRQQIVWGGGVRLSRYSIDGTQTLLFSPPGRTLSLVDLFAQDTVTVTSSLKLTLGLKLEDDAYAGTAPLPSARLSWSPINNAMVWASASQAIRSPTPFDRDVVEKLGATVFLTGNGRFESEKVTDYEIGARLQPTARASISLTTYYDVYDDLRSIEPNATTFIPLYWGNLLKGEIHGIEAWGDYQATPWWRLSASYNLLSEHFAFKPGASGLLGVSQIGDDPTNRADLRSAMNLSSSVVWDADLRYVDALPNPHVASYVELNTRLGWKLSRRITISISGFNLLHDHHQEAPGANAIPRSVLAGLQWRF